MNNNMPELSIIEEVIRSSWPTINSDASVLEDSSWEILNESNSHEVINRHWFKQNYIVQRPHQGAVIPFH